ncbi:prolipoprotein diacylglyceryl transferase [bacterium]|nr:prolipoprotein diacylglyceryl transferase [bacterium]
MILSSPGNVAFEFFGLPIYFYGIIMACAVLAGVFVAFWAWKKYYTQDSMILDLAPWLIITGIFGARVYYCLLNFHYYAEHLNEIFNVRQGGLSIHGMFLACLVFLIIFARCKKISLWKLSAPMLLGVSIAQSIGRWGNFFNSEAFGKPFDGFLKLYIAPQYRPPEFADCEYFHPAFLWESLLDLAIFVVLFLIMKKTNGKNPLFITSLYFFMYSVVRILIESIRTDSIFYVFNLPVATVVSIAIMFISLSGILYSVILCRSSLHNE